jgi:DNA-binding MarR family transcriptional regulator
MEKETPYITQRQLKEIEQQCMGLLTRQVARRVTQWYDQCLQPNGLRSTQFNLLVAIAIAQTVPLTRLAEILVLDRTTLARNLKPLEQQNLVRIELGEDRRVRLIRLTEPGYALLQQALPSWEKAQAEMMARLGPAQWDALQADLRDLVTRVP